MSHRVVGKLLRFSTVAAAVVYGTFFPVPDIAQRAVARYLDPPPAPIGESCYNYRQAAIDENQLRFTGLEACGEGDLPNCVQARHFCREKER